jgi:hypothetical protein
MGTGLEGRMRSKAQKRIERSEKDVSRMVEGKE